MISSFINLCGDLKVPISIEKTEWASEIIVFLGILLNGKDFSLGIPINKRERVIELLQEMLQSRKTTVKKLQQLCGFLNFIGKAIFPRRTFTRCMYAKYANVVQFPNQQSRKLTTQMEEAASFTDKKEKTQSFNYKYKQHYHVRIDKEFKADCQIWIDFLTGNLSEVVHRPMVDLFGQIYTSEDITFYSDASGSAKTGGYGCLLDKEWLYGSWGEDFIRQEEPSIEFLELYALCAGILTWENNPRLVDCRVSIFCDNQAVVHMVNNMSSSCKNCMYLLRLLTLNGLKFNRRLTAKFVDTKSNFLADALSRGQIDRFKRLGPHMNELPTKINENISPVWKVWNVFN